MANYYALNIAAQSKTHGAASVHIGALRIPPNVRVPISDTVLAAYRADIQHLIQNGMIELRDAETGVVVFGAAQEVEAPASPIQVVMPEVWEREEEEGKPLPEEPASIADLIASVRGEPDKKRRR